MKLPTTGAVATLLGDLLGRPCRVEPGQKPGFAEQGLIGVLVDRQGVPRALTFSDRSFAALTGAALALIPRAVAEDSIRKNVVAPNLLENHREIINIAASLFNATNPDALHLALSDIVPSGPSCPAPIRALLAKPSVRVDLVVDITGYGTGKLSFVA